MEREKKYEQNSKNTKTNLKASISIKAVLISIAKLFYKNQEYLLIPKINY